MHIQQEQEAAKKRASRLSDPAASPESQYLPSPRLAATAQRRLSPGDVLALQQTRGNAAVCRMLAAQRQAIVRRDADDENDTPAANQPDSAQPVSPHSNDSQLDTTQPNDSQPTAAQPDDSQPTATQPDDSQLTDTQPANDQPASDTSDDSNANANNANTDDNTDADNTDNGTPNLQPVSKSVDPLTLYATFAEAKGSTTDNPTGNLTINSATYQDLHNGTTRVTGQATVAFAANASINLPTVPASITDPCEQQQYQQAINTTLNAHEQKHKQLFETFNGSVRSAFNEVGKTVGDGEDMPDVTAALTAKLVDPPMDRTNSASRLAVAEAKSGAIDPFNFEVDMSKCNKK